MGARRVLIVDDDSDIRGLLVSVLTQDGYEARAAVNGRDALSVVDRWPPDLVVLDLMMPVMDGWTFAARLRETSTVPFIILSGAADIAGHGRTLGAADVVAKPFDLDTLLPMIERVFADGGGAQPG